MSYCRITLKGKEEGLKFNQMALIEIGERSLNNRFKPGTIQNDLYATTAIVFAGLRGNAYAKDIEETFTWEDCSEWVESATEAEKDIVVNTLIASEQYKQTTGYKKEEEKNKSKKKSVGKNTKGSASK